MPTRQIALHEEAAADYDAAFEWYGQRSPDAALKFDAEVERAMSEISRAPDRWARGSYDPVLAPGVSISPHLSGTI